MAKHYTSELSRIFKYINTDLIKSYPTNRMNYKYFLIAALEDEKSDAFEMLSKLTISENIESIKEWCYETIITDLSSPVTIEGNIKPNSDTSKFDDEFNRYMQSLDSEKIIGHEMISSGLLLLMIFRNNTDFEHYLKGFGINEKQLNSVLPLEKPADDNLPVKHKKRERATKQENSSVVLPMVKTSNIPNGETEKLLLNLNGVALEGKFGKAIDCEDTYNKMFKVLAKYNKNNVILVGENGVGKTTIARGLAHLLNSGEVPLAFRDKRLMELDILSLITTISAIKPVFEAKMKSIIDDASKKGVYIFYMDDIHVLLSNTAYFNENEAAALIEPFFDNKNIMMIATTTPSGYKKYIQSNPMLAKKITRIDVDEPDETKCMNILNSVKSKYEGYHNVVFSKSILSKAITLCKRYITNKKMPESVIDVMDETGAKISIQQKETEKVVKLRNDLASIVAEKNKIKSHGTKSAFDEIDSLLIRECDVKSQIAIAEKDSNLKRKKIDVSESDIREVISERSGVKISELDVDDKSRLKHMNEDIKHIVLGQDEAVDEVCKVVKRQRVGLGSSSKPAVLFFGGYTGSGKTYLAKKIAEKVFGDEKKMIRLDMSEYSDKTSATKLYGSSAGYIGYDNGGILTEAVKENKHCVLLLDEIEKADDDVFNVFLQIFDDGRLTDNRGVVVDFRNVIIIMTSNIGASEISSKSKNVGFVKNNNSMLNKDIINKALKTKFKPEFLNRIDKIVYFNKLNEDNLRNITVLEINKVVDKLAKIGYGVEDGLIEQVSEMVFDAIKGDIEYGARPINRKVQELLEDKIVDYMIDNDVPNGYKFKVKDLC